MTTDLVLSDNMQNRSKQLGEMHEFTPRAGRSDLDEGMDRSSELLLVNLGRAFRSENILGCHE